MLLSVEPIREIKLTLCVLDDRDGIYTEDDFARIFGDTTENPYFVAHYEASTNTYSILDIPESQSKKRFPGLQALLSTKEIDKLKFFIPNKKNIVGPEGDFSPTFCALMIFTNDLLDKINRKFNRTRTIISLRIWCPANLGHPHSSIITEETHILIKNFQPSSVVFVSHVIPEPPYSSEIKMDDVLAMAPEELLKQDIDNYFKRKLSRNGYRLIDEVTYGASLLGSSIEETLQQDDSHISAFDDNTPLIAPINSYSIGMLAVYIFSTGLTGKEKDFATLCSVPKHEPFICSVYHPQEDLYEFLDINTFPSSAKNTTRRRLRSIPVPVEKMAFDIFVQYLQILVGRSYFHSNKLRLFIEATLGDDESDAITPNTNILIQRLKPDCLHIFTREYNEEDSILFLHRKNTKLNFLLPNKHIEGGCVPLSMVHKHLFEHSATGKIKTGSSCATDAPNESSTNYESTGTFFQGIFTKSALKVSPSQGTFASVVAIEELSFDTREPFFEIQRCLNTNIIPRIAFSSDTIELQRLTPRSLDTLSETKNHFSLFRSSSVSHIPTKLHFIDQCGLRKMPNAPTLEEISTYRWSWYIVTDESFYYYSNLTRRVERVDFESKERELSGMQWLHQQFQDDVEHLSEQDLRLITYYSNHTHDAVLGSCISIDEDTAASCCQCVIQ